MRQYKFFDKDALSVYQVPTHCSHAPHPPLLVCDGVDGVQLYSSCQLAAINMLLVESSCALLEWSFVDNNRDGTLELKPK